MSKAKKVILGVTGSIAAYKAADLIRGLKEAGFMVTVVMTKEAERFISPLTLASLAGEEVYGPLFDKKNAWEMPHIHLAQEAGVLLIAPATANMIAKIAHGLADDLLSCMALSTTAKIIIAPAMNVEMYENPIVQANCAKLKELSYCFVEPVSGKLACGSQGVGHIADEDLIIKAVVEACA